MKTLPNIFKCLFFSILFLIPGATIAQGLDEKINEAFMPVANWWDALVFTSINMFGQSVPLVLVLLLSGALFFTIYFRFVNIRMFPLAIQVVRGKFDDLEKIE